LDKFYIAVDEFMCDTRIGKFPGVYGLYKEDDLVLYVGKSESNVRKRVLKHLSTFDDVEGIWILACHPADVAIVEALAIREMHPVHNSEGVIKSDAPVSWLGILDELYVERVCL